jgi:hypothetical protein
VAGQRRRRTFASSFATLASRPGSETTTPQWPANGVEFAVRPVQICFGGGGLNLPTEVLTYRRRGGIPSRQLKPEKCGSSLRHLDSGTESPVCRVENASLKVGRTPPHGATDHPWAVRLIVKLNGAAGLEACAAEPVSSRTLLSTQEGWPQATATKTAAYFSQRSDWRKDAAGAIFRQRTCSIGT